MRCRGCGSHDVVLEPGEFVHGVEIRHEPAELSDEEMERLELQATSAAAAAVKVHFDKHRMRRDDARRRTKHG